MADLTAARGLVQALLRELDAEARLVEFEEHPDGSQFVLRVERLNDVGKSIAVPRRTVLKALREGGARATLRKTLRAAVTLPPVGGATEAGREAPEGSTRAIPPCPVCLLRIAPGESVLFERGMIVHLRCPAPERG
jgi:hypothetical protein